MPIEYDFVYKLPYDIIATAHTVLNKSRHMCRQTQICVWIYLKNGVTAVVTILLAVLDVR